MLNTFLSYLFFRGKDNNFFLISDNHRDFFKNEPRFHNRPNHNRCADAHPELVLKTILTGTTFIGNNTDFC